MAKIETSIIIISALREEQTRQCLESIFIHTDKGYEVIVVDVGSYPGTIEWMKSLEQTKDNFRLIINKDSLGISATRNQGIKNASGKYLVFMDNDVIVTKGWLKELIKVAKSADDIGMVGAKILRMDSMVHFFAGYMAADFNENGDLKGIGLRWLTPYERYAKEVLHQQDVEWYPTTCLLAKKDIIQKLGGFDEILSTCEEDKDLCIRVRNAGYRIVYCPKSEVFHNHDYRKVDRDDEYHRKFRLKKGQAPKSQAYFRKKWNCEIIFENRLNY
jgi:GT2 family glycosyltransferase